MSDVENLRAEVRSVVELFVDASNQRDQIVRQVMTAFAKFLAAKAENIGPSGEVYPEVVLIALSGEVQP